MKADAWTVAAYRQVVYIRQILIAHSSLLLYLLYEVTGNVVYSILSGGVAILLLYSFLKENKII